MATNYGAPTGLDLSACSVTATGGSTSQTLADLGKAVGDNATALASAADSITTATQTATAASADAKAATTAVSGLGTTYLPLTAVGAANGVVQLESDGTAVIPPLDVNNNTPAINFGYGTAIIPDGSSAMIIYNGNAKNATDYHNWNNPDGSANFGRYLDGTVLTGRSSGSLNIGVAAQPVNTVYSQNAAVVTSDAATKTIAGVLTDASYEDGQKLITALATVKPTVYQLNASIAEKGAAAARYHVGYIAQDVEAAITAAGLDPAKFALWTKTALFTVTQNDKGTFSQTATVDASGNQKYIQMLRYEEIFPIILAGLASQMSALTTRVSALEAAGKTTTGGAA